MGDAVITMSESLRTFTEAMTGDEGARAKQFLDTAKRVVFLGSAFHRQNLQLLTGGQGSVDEYKATVYGLSRSNQNEVVMRLGKIFPKAGVQPEGLGKCKCAQLIEDERLFLSK
jgi:hypothetical protein